MKKAIYVLLFAFFLSNCSKDSTSDSIGNFEGAIIEGSTTVKFDKLMFLVNVKFSNGKYLVTNRIDTLLLKVDTKKWGEFISESKDTTGLSDGIYSGFRVSSKKTNYLIYATYTPDSVGTKTAGDYVKYIKQRLALAVGDHVAEINELKIKNLSSKTILFYPQVFIPLVVDSATTSAYLGEIEILIP